jgi:hypothetical protein
MIGGDAIGILAQLGHNGTSAHLMRDGSPYRSALPIVRSANTGCVRWSVRGGGFLSGAHAGEVGGDGVGGVAVEVGLGHVVLHGGARCGLPQYVHAAMRWRTVHLGVHVGSSQ